MCPNFTLLQDLRKLKTSNNIDINKGDNSKINNKKLFLLGLLGIIFLIFNCILVTSFYGIYPNSVSKIEINTIFSIIGTFPFVLILSLIGACLRKKGCKKISRLFEPVVFSCNDIKTIKNNKNNNIQQTS